MLVRGDGVKESAVVVDIEYRSVGYAVMSDDFKLYARKELDNAETGFVYDGHCHAVSCIPVNLFNYQRDQHKRDREDEI